MLHNTQMQVWHFCAVVTSEWFFLPSCQKLSRLGVSNASLNQSCPELHCSSESEDNRFHETLNRHEVLAFFLL